MADRFSVVHDRPDRRFKRCGRLVEIAPQGFVFFGEHLFDVGGQIALGEVLQSQAQRLDHALLLLGDTGTGFVGLAYRMAAFCDVSAQEHGPFGVSVSPLDPGKGTVKMQQLATTVRFDDVETPLHGHPLQDRARQILGQAGVGLPGAEQRVETRTQHLACGHAQGCCTVVIHLDAIALCIEFQPDLIGINGPQQHSVAVRFRIVGPFNDRTDHLARRIQGRVGLDRDVPFAKLH